jgi:hypothetical protein
VFWIDDRIYWIILSAWLNFTVNCYTHCCPQSRLHCRYKVAPSNGGRPFSGYPNCHQPHLPASNSNSSPRPILSTSLLAMAWRNPLLLAQLSAWTVQKIQFLCCQRPAERRIFFFRFSNLFAICRDTFSKWCVGKRGRVEECSVAPLRNRRVKTLCGCQGTN